MDLARKSKAARHNIARGRYVSPIQQDVLHKQQ